MIVKQKGTNDLFGIEAKKSQYIEEVIKELFSKYNYSYIRTPLFESSQLFHRGIGDTSDIITKETYDFKDRGDRDITLRPEGTAGVVRSYIENKMYGEPQPVKLYYLGTMYRYERPQAGREREFTQVGVEALGSNNPLIDAEVIALASNIFRILGLENVVVNINSLGDKESRNNYREALLEYFKPYIDNMCDDCKTRFKNNPLRILDCKVDADKEIIAHAPSILKYLTKEANERFEEVQEYLKEMGITYSIKDKMVRGLDYYNHTVFEVEILSSSLGKQNVLAAGGRYNSLVEDLDGPNTPGIGFACGMERLLMALETEKIELPITDDLDVFVMYVSPKEKMFAANLVETLRLNGFSTETEYMERSLKTQFKQADRLKSKILLILNGDYLVDNKVQLKNNITKEERKVDIDNLVYAIDQELYNIYEINDCGCDCHDQGCNCKECHNDK